ncbi:MAG: hypothetical protein HYW78_01410 [Parcubacteria group bacterium]|nr:hypothetical protein [Parcubacteria group bacterium]
MLNKIEITVDLLQCDFCGTVHTSQEDADWYGCTEKIPEQRFKIDDIVLAPFTVGAGIEAVGTETAHGRVTGIYKQVVSERMLLPSRGKGDYTRRDALIYIQTAPHDWIITIKSIDEPKEQNRYFLSTENFSQSQLKLADNQNVCDRKEKKHENRRLLVYPE